MTTPGTASTISTVDQRISALSKQKDIMRLVIKSQHQLCRANLHKNPKLITLANEKIRVINRRIANLSSLSDIQTGKNPQVTTAATSQT